MPQPPSGDFASGCLLRTFWLFAGPAFLLVFAVPIARSGRSGFWIHVLYAGTLAAAAIARLLDRAASSAQPAPPTAAAPPPTRPYLIALLVGGMALWAVAYWLGPRIFG